MAPSCFGEGFGGYGRGIRWADMDDIVDLGPRRIRGDYGPVWAGRAGFNPIWGDRLGWMGGGNYRIWRRWQRALAGFDLAISDRRSMLIEMLLSEHAGGSRGEVEELADRMLSSTNEIGTDEHGHVEEVTTTTTTTTTTQVTGQQRYACANKFLQDLQSSGGRGTTLEQAQRIVEAIRRGDKDDMVREEHESQKADTGQASQVSHLGPPPQTQVPEQPQSTQASQYTGTSVQSIQAASHHQASHMLGQPPQTPLVLQQPHPSYFQPAHSPQYQQSPYYTPNSNYMTPQSMQQLTTSTTTTTSMSSLVPGVGPSGHPMQLQHGQQYTSPPAPQVLPLSQPQLTQSGGDQMQFGQYTEAGQYQTQAAQPNHSYSQGMPASYGSPSAQQHLFQPATPQNQAGVFPGVQGIQSSVQPQLPYGSAGQPTQGSGSSGTLMPAGGTPTRQRKKKSGKKKTLF